MKKIGIMLAALVLCAISASATRISKSKAQAKAVSFFQKGLVKELSKGAEVKLAKEYASSAEAPAAVFAFSRGENVVFVSAEDKMPAILGYSSNADVNNLPPALEEMLRYYAHLSDAVREGRIEAPKLYASETAVDSLIHTCWYQEAPFWNLCPVVEGMNTASGCVATAFSMVLKYHNWPDKPEGKAPKYTTRTHEIEMPEVDLESHTYKWDDMINIYKKGEYTEEQGQAVAQLMYDIGVASQMNYDESSGTQFWLAAEAMRKYFKYNKGFRLDCADFHTEEEWATMLKNELRQGRPLPYDAQTYSTPPNGHCFVVDGFNTEGLFHINWGWGGRSDGFFLITSLNPKEQGVGGSDPQYSYCMRQRTLFDFVPDKTGTSTPSEDEYFFRYVKMYKAATDSIIVSDIENWSIADFHGDIILQLTDKNGNEVGQVTAIKDCLFKVDCDQDSSIKIADLDFSSIADGTYYTELLFAPNKSEKKYRSIHSLGNLRIVIENGKIKSFLNNAVLEGEILNFDVISYKNYEFTFKIKYKVKNVDDFDFVDYLSPKADIYRTDIGHIITTSVSDGLDIKGLYKELKVGESFTDEKTLQLETMSALKHLDQSVLRVYISYPNGSLDKKEYPLSEFIATGIKDINRNKVEGKSPAFSLDGKRVSDDYKGVVIKDNKKTLNK